MEITFDTKISKIINHSPEAIDQIASVNKHFEKLRNPILRKLLASRVTIKDAARIGGCEPMILIEKLCAIGFTFNGQNKPIESNLSTERPDAIPSHLFIVKTIDIQPFLDANTDPFDTIMNETSELKDGECIEIISPFKPIPLERVLAKKGYAIYSTTTDQIFKTYFVKEKGQPNQEEPSESMISADSLNEKMASINENLVYLDVSQMEMPLPMVTILSQLENLQDGQALHVKHRKIPQYLLPELKERKFEILIHERNSLEYDLLIFKGNER